MGIPEGALIQKIKNKDGIEVSYVYFPSYFYNKEAKTKRKGRSKRLYIGKLVGDNFVANKVYADNPNLTRKDVGTERKVFTNQFQETKSVGTTWLLYEAAIHSGLKDDLEKVYGNQLTLQILSLASFMLMERSSALYLFNQWQPRFWLPSKDKISSQRASELLTEIGSDQSKTYEFFKLRAEHVRAHEYLAYDSTKIASESNNIPYVRFGPNKQGGISREIGVAILCGQETGTPVMFRILPGNLPDVSTVKDLLSRWNELGINKEATVVMDRGYSSESNLVQLCQNSIRFVIAQSCSQKWIKQVIDEALHHFWESKHHIDEYNYYGCTQEVTLKGGIKVWVHLFGSKKLVLDTEAVFYEKLISFEQLYKQGKAILENNQLAKFYINTQVNNERGPLHRDFLSIDQHLSHEGFFAVASNYVNDPATILKIYRRRDSVEKVFANFQSGLDVTSTGVHGNDSLHGKLLLCLVALTLRAVIELGMETSNPQLNTATGKLSDKYSFNELLNELKNILVQKTTGFPSRTSEITSGQALIYSSLGYPLPVGPEMTL